MTRKDYINLANRLSGTYPASYAGTQTEVATYKQWYLDISAIADAFQADNPRFDRDKFMAACLPKGIE